LAAFGSESTCSDRRTPAGFQAPPGRNRAHWKELIDHPQHLPRFPGRLTSPTNETSPTRGSFFWSVEHVENNVRALDSFRCPASKRRMQISAQPAEKLKVGA